jgi:hypothetical protein
MSIDGFDDGRRHGERWAEIAIASHVRETAAALPEAMGVAMALLRDLADRIEAGAWRRPEMHSIVDSEEVGK